MGSLRIPDKLVRVLVEPEDSLNGEEHEYHGNAIIVVFSNRLFQDGKQGNSLHISNFLDYNESRIH